MKHLLSICPECIYYNAFGELHIDHPIEWIVRATDIYRGIERLKTKYNTDLDTCGETYFSNHPCDCCNGLAGDRYDVYVEVKD